MSQSIASDRISESTIARIAGNLLSGLGPPMPPNVADGGLSEEDGRNVTWAVAMARKIAQEVALSGIRAPSCPACAADMTPVLKDVLRKQDEAHFQCRECEIDLVASVARLVTIEQDQQGGPNGET